MAEQTSAGQSRQSAPAPEPHIRPVTIGGVVFAVCILSVVGAYHVIAGLAAIIDHNFYRSQQNYAYDFSVSGWGWIQLISGIVIVAAAFNLFSGRTWARAVGIGVAVASMLETFFFTPYYPVWSVVLIALDVLVIWSLATYGHREAHKVYNAPL
ncbi:MULTISPECIES: DUF7144 family membrane protein [Streptomyces]|uniref:DUF7144 domain-containing protein n=2 Tax=Streptomyces rimosus subsp. rimosus TaxID=132474 RepID=L8EM96_STRR1|nr:MULTISPECIES: hypothetical protein [Streptomyces]KWT56830.1 hypothetical protein ADL21_38375 [Streptomyces albus subsp. albus]MYT44374.1 hypothetical protein [Streptomyces sp. SID5471]KOT46346.1 membrane protein [Streptomyces rimosus subsp. rimosus]KOT47562.1 membrane protein [Streptomyces sp. NRRL WC-3701]KOT61846.1 membrane protein [Streptomyces rimosus subsp. rimosus]